MSPAHLLACAAVLACLGFVTTASATAAARCGDIDFHPSVNSEQYDVVMDIRAVRTTCRVARSVARGAKGHGAETDHPGGRYTRGGFRCVGTVDPMSSLVDWTCRRGRARITFGS